MTNPSPSQAEREGGRGRRSSSATMARKRIDELRWSRALARALCNPRRGVLADLGGPRERVRSSAFGFSRRGSIEEASRNREQGLPSGRADASRSRSWGSIQPDLDPGASIARVRCSSIKALSAVIGSPDQSSATSSDRAGIVVGHRRRDAEPPTAGREDGPRPATPTSATAASVASSTKLGSTTSTGSPPAGKEPEGALSEFIRGSGPAHVLAKRRPEPVPESRHPTNVDRRAGNESLDATLAH